MSVSIALLGMSAANNAAAAGYAAQAEHSAEVAKCTLVLQTKPVTVDQMRTYSECVQTVYPKPVLPTGEPDYLVLLVVAFIALSVPVSIYLAYRANENGSDYSVGFFSYMLFPLAGLVSSALVVALIALLVYGIRVGLGLA